jgi:hypothetical protein
VAAKITEDLHQEVRYIIEGSIFIVALHPYQRTIVVVKFDEVFL